MLHTYNGRQFFAEPTICGTTELWGYGEHTTYPEPYCEVVREYEGDPAAFAQLVEDWLLDAMLIDVVEGGDAYEAVAVLAEMQRDAEDEAEHVNSYRSTYFTRSNLL